MVVVFPKTRWSSLRMNTKREITTSTRSRRHLGGHLSWRVRPSGGATGSWPDPQDWSWRRRIVIKRMWRCLWVSQHAIIDRDFLQLGCHACIKCPADTAWLTHWRGCCLRSSITSVPPSRIISGFVLSYVCKRGGQGEVQYGIYNESQCISNCLMRPDCYGADFNWVESSCWFHVTVQTACSAPTFNPSWSHHRRLLCSDGELIQTINYLHCHKSFEACGINSNSIFC